MALVGGALLSTFLEPLLEKMTSKEFLNFFAKKKPMVSLLIELKETLLELSDAVDNGEEQIIDSQVREWLDGLKNAFFDVEDLLDEIDTHILPCKMEISVSESLLIRSPSPGIISRRSVYEPLKTGLTAIDAMIPMGCGQRGLIFRDRQMGKTAVQNVLSPQEYISNIMNSISRRLLYLAIQKDILFFQNVISKVFWKTPVPPMISGTSVVGRDKDKEALMKMLLSDDNTSGVNIGVVAIVGMDGIGKTTLAQLLYNNNQVQNDFDLKSWVCVSEEFDASRVTKYLLESITSKSYSGMCQDSLQAEINQKLNGKKFLFVLDDMQFEDYGSWHDLISPLSRGKHGSRIVVTTRFNKVAQIVSTFPIFRLPPLSDEECWSIFVHHAFGNGGFNKIQNLKSIGRRIVRKCNGLPLATKLLGGLLRTKVSAREWNTILDSDMWDLTNDGIVPAVHLSFSDLPSHLKRCFAYCSIFPRDHIIDRKKLILLWMTEGLVQKSQSRKRTEDVGDDYFAELVSRSLLQQFSSYNEEIFVMHNLIYDLATNVSGNGCFKFEDGIFPYNVLHVEGLKYICLSVPIQRCFAHYHDSSFCNLVYLKIGHCEHCYSLPPLGQLPSIKELYICELQSIMVIDVEFYGNASSSFPPFPSLQILSFFDMPNWEEWLQLKGERIGFPFPFLVCLRLQNCPKLRGYLPYHLPPLLDFDISGCPQIVVEEQSHAHVLLQSDGAAYAEISRSPDVLEKIHELTPDFDAVTEIQEDFDEDDDSIDSLSDLDTFDFFSFETLKVSDASELKELPQGLRSLRIEGCRYLKSLVAEMVNKSLNLAELDLVDCHSLRHFVDERYCTSLTTLHIEECRKLKFPLSVVTTQIFAGLQHLYILSSCDSLESFTLNLFPKLKTLCIWDCPNLKSLSISEGFQGDSLELKFLEIQDCPSLASFSAKSLPAPGLISIRFSNCKILQSLPNNWASLESLMAIYFDRCPELESFPAGDLPSTLDLLSIVSSNKLIPLREWELQRLHSLRRFEIESGCVGMESFPAKGLLPINLRSLRISKLSSLTSLDDMGLQDLTSLQSLEINCCEKLDSLPYKGLPRSLRYLCIKECPLLTNKLLCEAEIKSDWEKIAWIPNIKINDKIISSNSTGGSFI